MVLHVSGDRELERIWKISAKDALMLPYLHISHFSQHLAFVDIDFLGVISRKLQRKNLEVVFALSKRIKAELRLTCCCSFETPKLNRSQLLILNNTFISSLQCENELGRIT